MTVETSIALPALVGDIGGTNARFQYVVSKDEPVIEFDTVATADFETVEDAIRQAVLDQSDIRPATAILAAAGPITRNGLDLTNCHWNIRPEKFLDAGPFRNLLLMNDFEAQALSLPFLTDHDLHDLEPLTGSKPTATGQQRATKAVLGPGTGLGVALLVHAAGMWVPVAGEGGHVDLGPRNDREAELFAHLEKVGGRVSGEQVVCGPGLFNIYQACCAADGMSPELNSPAEISSAAMAGQSPQAVEALEVFCTCLGRLAGDLALTSMATGGVYISGGIARKILPFLENSGFRAAFDDKAPHQAIVSNIKTRVVTRDIPALLGLSQFARSPEAFALDIAHRWWTRT